MMHVCLISGPNRPGKPYQISCDSEAEESGAPVLERLFPATAGMSNDHNKFLFISIYIHLLPPVLFGSNENF